MQPEEMLETIPATEPERQPFWGYLDLLLLIGLGCTAFFALALILGVIVHGHPEFKDQKVIGLPFQFAVYAAVYGCFFVLFKLKYGRPVMASLGWQKSTFNLWTAMGLGVLLEMALGLLNYLLRTPKLDLPFDKLISGPFTMALLAITAMMAAPLMEEMMFRGFLQPLLSRTFGIAAGVIATGVAFGVLHGYEYQWQWQYLLSISLIGIALGSLRAKTNSIIPGVFMHGAFNGLAVAGLFATKFLHIK